MSDFSATRCGVYLPVQTSDISADLLLQVGSPMRFVQLWEIETGRYAGQTAYGACDMDGNAMQVGWIPACDIAWLEPSHESEAQ